MDNIEVNTTTGYAIKLLNQAIDVLLPASEYLNPLQIDNHQNRILSYPQPNIPVLSFHSCVLSQKSTFLYTLLEALSVSF